jgi:hypothetical protein
VKRAWTEGPWRKGELGESQFDVYDANGDSIIEPSDRAEFVSHEIAELVALAPDLAEAILAMPIAKDTTHHIWVEALRLQDKLRQIGGE